jgi:hypothetical protein
METNNVYENSNYEVIVYDGVYVIRNKKTKVMEYDTSALPKAILTAEEYNRFLVDLEAKSQKSKVVPIENTPARLQPHPTR